MEEKEKKAWCHLQEVKKEREHGRVIVCRMKQKMVIAMRSLLLEKPHVVAEISNGGHLTEDPAGVKE